MKRLIFVFSLFLSFSALWAGPESYDHLDSFKKSSVAAKGPSEEKMETSDGKITAKAVYTYNNKGQLIRADYFADSKADGYTVYSYSNDGLSEEKLYDKKGSLIEIIKYKIKKDLVQSYKVTTTGNKNKVEVEWLFQYKDNKLAAGTRSVNKETSENFTLTENGHEKIQTIFNAQSEKMATIEYLFENGNLKSRVRKEITGVKKIDYVYDKKGRLIKMLFYDLLKGKEKLVKTHSLKYSSLTSKSYKVNNL
ncbi:MAG: hypothetical protein OEZ13_07430 [Spirochaetia bacterium]|nr:hypothetical protein [Spirochaetia bacterium]